MNEVYITAEQLEKLKEEYQHYIQVKRPEIVQRIKEAKSFGDLSENSEYDSARDEQAFVEQKIQELSGIINNAQIIEDTVDSDIVALGTTVTYKDVTNDVTKTYRIVGVGANPLDREKPSISTGTDVARGLLGRAVGDRVEIDIPSGKKILEIISIA